MDTAESSSIVRSLFHIQRHYGLGAQRSYSSLSAGSKQVNKAGSARIVTLRPGVACAELGVELRWRYREREGSTMREPLDMVEDVGDESPALPLPFYETPLVCATCPVKLFWTTYLAEARRCAAGSKSRIGCHRVPRCFKTVMSACSSGKASLDGDSLEVFIGGVIKRKVDILLRGVLSC